MVDFKKFELHGVDNRFVYVEMPGINWFTKGKDKNNQEFTVLVLSTGKIFFVNGLAAVINKNIFREGFIYLDILRDRKDVTGQFSAWGYVNLYNVSCIDEIKETGDNGIFNFCYLTFKNRERLRINLTIKKLVWLLIQKKQYVKGINKNGKNKEIPKQEAPNDQAANAHN